MTAPAFDASCCDIVIPIWNQPVLTKRCLESILSCTEEPVQLILVDNASASPTQEFLEDFKESSPIPTLLLRNPTNQGFIRAANQGIQKGRSPWVCILNNDTVVTPGWLTEMIKVALADPRIGLVNPTSNSLGFHPGEMSVQDYAGSLKVLSGQWAELSVALGFCLLARRSLWEGIGLFDESFGMGNFDDDDLSLRAKSAGFRCARACASYVFHEEKASFRLLPGWEKAFEENRRRFEQRWGRRLRILSASLSKEVALELLAQGHWLTLCPSREMVPPEVLSHAQVACLGTDTRWWRWRATLRLLWKRKKPFQLVISPDPGWSRCLKFLRWFHSAKILNQPSDQEILQRCQELSRCR